MNGRRIEPGDELPPRLLFVTVGSGDFDPLIRAVDAIASELDLPVVTQIGIGRYEPRNTLWFRLAPSLEPFYRRADVVIAHGGVGVTMEVLNRGIPLVSVDNPDRPDQHQEDLLGHLSAKGHLVWCRDLGRLREAIERARKESLVPFSMPPTAIHLIVERFLQAVAAGEDVNRIKEAYRGRRVRPEDVHELF